MKPWESPYGRRKEKNQYGRKSNGHLYGAAIEALEFGVLIPRPYWPAAYVQMCESRMRWINYGLHVASGDVVVNFYNERDASAFRLIFPHPTTVPDR